jgi:hypothetical protein
MDNQVYSATHLNTLRASIASVFNIIHNDKTPIAENPLIIEFFVVKRKSEVKAPTQSQLTTWDINILINHISNNLSPTENLSLDELQKKTILLLCIATMWRPRSDIGRLQHQDVNIVGDEENSVTSVRLYVREPKESQIKSVIIGQYHNYELCPVSTLTAFMQKTTQFRSGLPEDHTLFLTYLNDILQLRPPLFQKKQWQTGSKKK